MMRSSCRIDKNGMWILILPVILVILTVGCVGDPSRSEQIKDKSVTVIVPTATLLPEPEKIQINPLNDQLIFDTGSWVADTLSSMSLEEKAGQVILSGIPGDSINPDVCADIAELKPAGIKYMPANVESSEQLRQFSADLQECAEAANSEPLLIAYSEVRSGTLFPGGVEFVAALAVGATGDKNLAYQAAYVSGQELAYSGVNMILGPVADVLTNLENRLFSLRTFGGDPDQVKVFVKQAVTGYSDAGLVSVLKHFPGHGSGDTFYATKILPIDEVGADVMESVYLPPFIEGMQAGAPIVMVNHVIFPRITASYEPASLSPEIMTLLRDQIGFNGVIMTDAILSTEGITINNRDVPEAAYEAFKAGADLLYIPEANQTIPTRERLIQAVEQGQIPEGRLDESVKRILSVKKYYGLDEFPSKSEMVPDWDRDSKFTSEIAKKALTVYKDEADLLPIPNDIHSILIIGPDPDWGFYMDLRNALLARGINADFAFYSPPWDGVVEERELLQTLPKKAENYDLTIFFTWRAYIQSLNKDAWQVNLGKRLAKLEKPVMIIALDSPTDLLGFPKVDSYLASFGNSDGQMQAIIDTLVGKWNPTGINPIPGVQP